MVGDDVLGKFRAPEEVEITSFIQPLLVTEASTHSKK